MRQGKEGCQRQNVFRGQLTAARSVSPPNEPGCRVRFDKKKRVRKTVRPPAIGCCCSGVWKTGTGLGCRRCDVRQGKALGVELRLFGTSVGCTVSDGREFYLAVPSLGPCALMDCEHWWTYRLQPATGLRLPRPLLWWHCRLEEGGRSKDGGEGSLACDGLACPPTGHAASAPRWQQGLSRRGVALAR